jgi:hypothetical protein
MTSTDEKVGRFVYARQFGYCESEPNTITVGLICNERQNLEMHLAHLDCIILVYANDCQHIFRC